MANSQCNPPSGHLQPRPPKYDRLNDLSGKMTPEAIARAEHHIDTFIESFVSHAETRALQKKNERILTTHVDEALDMIQWKPRKSKLKELGILVSGALFGIAIPEFFSALSRLTDQPPTGNPNLVIIYFVMALITLAISVWLVLED